MLLDGIEYCDVCGQPRQVPVREVMPTGMEVSAAFSAVFARNGLLPVTCDCHERAEVERACRSITFSKSRFQTVAYRLCFDECRAAVMADKWNVWAPHGFAAWPSAILCGEWTRGGRRTSEPIPAALLAGVGTRDAVRSGTVKASLAPYPTARRPEGTWAMFREIGGL